MLNTISIVKRFWYLGVNLKLLIKISHLGLFWTTPPRSCLYTALCAMYRLIIQVQISRKLTSVHFKREGLPSIQGDVSV